MKDRSMDQKIRLLWAATMMLTIATTAAHGRTINSSNSDGVDDGSSTCALDPPNPCPPPPPPPPPVFSAACESSFQGPGSQDFDCRDYLQGAASTLLAAQGVLDEFKAVTDLDLYGNPLFAAPDFSTPNFGVLDALMGAGSSNTGFDAVFDAGTRQGQIKLLQRLDGEFMAGLGGTWGASGAETPWSAYYFFAASPDNIAGSEITFTLPARTADFTDFRLKIGRAH